MPTVTTTSTLSRLKDDCCLLPSLQTERIKALLFCRRIAHVAIGEPVKIGNAACYAVQAFFTNTTSNIPTRQRRILRSAMVNTTTNPDRVTHQRFSAFVGLCNELRYHAHVGCGLTTCDFCHELRRVIRTERPRLRTKLFHGGATTQQVLEQFINATLVLVRDRLRSTPSSSCDAEHEAPMLLARFLTEPFDPSKLYATRSDGPKEGPTL